MGTKGRCVGSMVALCGILLAAVACGDASVDAYCRSQRQGKPRHPDLLTHVLEQNVIKPVFILLRPAVITSWGPYGGMQAAGAEQGRRLSHPRQGRQDAAYRFPRAWTTIRHRRPSRSLWPRAYVRRIGKGPRFRMAAIRFTLNMSAPTKPAPNTAATNSFKRPSQDSEIVLKSTRRRRTPTANAGFAHYAVGHDAMPQALKHLLQKDPDPKRAAGYENRGARYWRGAAAKEIPVAGISRMCGKGLYDREMERQQNGTKARAISGFNECAEACRTDGSKC